MRNDLQLRFSGLRRATRRAAALFAVLLMGTGITVAQQLSVAGGETGAEGGGNCGSYGRSQG